MLPSLLSGLKLNSPSILGALALGSLRGSQPFSWTCPARPSTMFSGPAWKHLLSVTLAGGSKEEDAGEMSSGVSHWQTEERQLVFFPVNIVKVLQPLQGSQGSLGCRPAGPWKGFFADSLFSPQEAPSLCAFSHLPAFAAETWPHSLSRH